MEFIRKIVVLAFSLLLPFNLNVEFPIDFKKIDYKEIVDMLLEEKEVHGKATTKYIKDVVYGTKRHGKQIKKQIEECLSEKWTYDRIYKVNILSLLQICYL